MEKKTSFVDKLKENKNIIYLVIIAVAVIISIVLIAGYMKNRDNQQIVSPASETSKEKDTKSEAKVLVSISTETIRDGLANMGFLVTQEYYFTNVETYTKEKKVFFNMIDSSSQMVFKYDGQVFAGVDFEKITITKDDATRTVTIDIPDAEIQSVAIDKDSFESYSEKESIWNPLKLDDYNAAMAEYEKTAKQKALDSGILERADEQAKAIVQNFVNSFPATAEYTIVYQ